MFASELKEISMAVVNKEADKFTDTLLDIVTREMHRRAQSGHFNFSISLDSDIDVSEDVLDLAKDKLRNILVDRGFVVVFRGKSFDVSWRGA